MEGLVMKTKSIIFLGLLLAVMIGFLADWGMATKPLGPWRIGLDTAGRALIGGPTHLIFRVCDPRPSMGYDKAFATIRTMRGLALIGDTLIHIKPTHKWDTLSFPLMVSIPGNDTSGISVHLFDDALREINSDELYFVPSGDTALVYKSWPTPPEPPQPDIGTPDYLKPDFGKPLVYTGDRGYVDIDSSGTTRFPTGAEQKQILEREPLTRDYGQLVFADGVPYIRLRGQTTFHLADSSEMNDSVRIINSRDLTDKMVKAAMEIGPLKYADGQNLEAEGKQWHRSRGERLFALAEEINIREGLKEDDRKRWEATKNDPVDVTMDLRKAADNDFARQLFPDLQPMESAGYYHVRTVRQKAALLEQHGIRIGKYPVLPPDTTRRVKPDSLLRPQHRKTTSHNIH
jgi:hypothetical protein